MTEDNRLYSWGYAPTHLFNDGVEPYINHPVRWGTTTYKVAAPTDNGLITIDESGDMYGVGSTYCKLLGFNKSSNSTCKT